MSSRDAILARLRAQRRDAAPQPVWTSRRDFADLGARFEQALTAAGGEVQRVADWPAALDALAALLDGLGARRAVLNDEPPLNAVDWSARHPALTWTMTGRSADLRQACVDADVGISMAAFALAETGSVAVQSGVGRSRLVTLLPPVHVVLLPSERLTADLFTWTAARDGALPANIAVISGPSKSADIGLTLAVGVHGPKRLITILYDDATL